MDLWRRGKALWAEFSSVGAGTYASSIAFFAFLSLIPLLTLSISLVTFMGIGEEEIARFFVALVPDAFDDFARGLLRDAFRSSGIAFSLSTITLLWSASKGMRALRAGLNATYGEKETRNWFVVVGISILAALILGVLFAVTIYLVFGGAVMRGIEGLAPDLHHQGSVMNALNSTVMAVSGVFALCACYSYLPDGSRRFRAQLPGAVLASLLCGLVTIGFHVYVDNFCNYDALYGSIATVALFLFWLYIVSYILLLGAFLNRTLAHREETTRDESENA